MGSSSTCQGFELDNNRPYFSYHWFLAISQHIKSQAHSSEKIDLYSVARSVRVRLLVPRHIDQKIVGYASRTYYGELLEAGVHIYQYDKGMLHAKLMIIDEEIAEVDANYDMRSFRLNYEVCEVLYSADVARELTQQFERGLTVSIHLRIEDLLQRSPDRALIKQVY